MNNIKDLPKELPSMTYSFEIEVEGNVTRKAYDGEFTCRIPNNRDRSMISKHKAYLNGGFEIDISTDNLHHMLAYLRYTLLGPDIKKDMAKGYPNWWRDSDLGLDLYDDNVVEKVYAKVLNFESKWLKEVWGDPEEKEAEADEKG